MSGQWPRDEDLLDALAEALRTEAPRRFVAAGKAAFTWFTVDAELAALAYDSAESPAEPAATRDASASVRAISFESPRITIELQLVQDGLVGQLVPPVSATVELHLAGGRRVAVPVDEVGAFVVRPLPAGTFRLCCRVGDADVLTDWINS